MLALRHCGLSSIPACALYFYFSVICDRVWEKGTFRAKCTHGPTKPGQRSMRASSWGRQLLPLRGLAKVPPYYGPIKSNVECLPACSRQLDISLVRVKPGQCACQSGKIQRGGSSVTGQTSLHYHMLQCQTIARQWRIDSFKV